MYMPNARRPHATYIPLTCVGVYVGGNVNFSVRVGGYAHFSVFRYQHVGIPNAKFRVGGLTQHADLTQMFSRCSGMYFTRTQIKLRWGFMLCIAPNTSNLRCRYQHAGIEKALCTQSKPRSTQCESQSTQRDPQHEQVEYSSRWAISRWHHVGHVDFMLFVSFLFELGTQHE